MKLLINYFPCVWEMNLDHIKMEEFIPFWQSNTLFYHEAR